MVNVDMIGIWWFYYKVYVKSYSWDMMRFVIKFKILDIWCV